MLVDEAARFSAVGIPGVRNYHRRLERAALNISNVMGITVATVFRLYTYRRWVFLVAVEAVAGDRLQPEISGI